MAFTKCSEMLARTQYLVFKISRLLVVIFFILYSVRCDDGASAVRYDAASFEQNVPNKAHFVMFFAPWCGHCKRLHPTWEELADKYKQSSEKPEEVVIAKVDCTTDTALCSEHDVTGYPTLKFFKPGDSLATRYRGKRDLESLEQFIQEQLGNGTISVTDEVRVDVPEAKHSLVELGDDTFHKHVKSGFHFVKFYAPWCGHCQKLAPTWEALADSYKHDGTVSISKVDCMAHSDVCQEYEVKGYPTLIWIQDGKEVTKYLGDRTHEDLKTFITKMKGSSEPADDSDEGRVPDLTVSAVVQLTSENFENAVSSGTTFIKFYAPWCTHCKRLASTWDELSRKFIGSVNVKIAKVDCTVDGNKKLCNDNKVEGYPTILLFKDGVNTGEYSGARDLASLHDYVRSSIGRDEL